MGDGLSELFEQADFAHAGLAGAVSPEDLFSILENFEDAVSKDSPLFNGYDSNGSSTNLLSPGSVRPFADVDQADDEALVQARKKLKTSTGGPPGDSADAAAVGSSDGLQKVSHITVERNRRKQMNEHLTVLRSLMPSFYVKRGDQASIIGGVIDYIKELQQVLRSLEAKKQRKVYSEVLSPRPLSSPRPSPLSPRPLPPSPRVVLPISPRTPQPGSPYKPRLQQSYLSPALTPSHRGSSPPSFDSGSVASSELAANSKSPVADVEVKFSGANLLLKTVSQRIPGQATKIIAALEGLALEILHVNINTVDDTMLNSFTIKIGIECELSAEELAQQVQHTFS